MPHDDAQLYNHHSRIQGRGRRAEQASQCAEQLAGGAEQRGARIGSQRRLFSGDVWAILRPAHHHAKRSGAALQLAAAGLQHCGWLGQLSEAKTLGAVGGTPSPSYFSVPDVCLQVGDGDHLVPRHLLPLHQAACESRRCRLRRVDAGFCASCLQQGHRTMWLHSKT